ncbi:MBOAT family O-acyltransferase [Calothrix rhizosoleniae]|uniref:MBOAT family O-acyltransferase n=1 Tax=Calothrix rhizosoleniae TaxID=888997 RepID=UPI000B4A13BF|nr:MBOAT family protein [Calothrix rhizosoleniae]
MNFISLLYGVFLLSSLGIYWSIKEKKWKYFIILVASLVFYASLQIYYIPLLLTLIFLNFRLGKELGENTSPGKHNLDWWMSNEQWQIAQSDWNRRRLKILWLGICLNILLLIGFKYIPPLFNFFHNYSSTSNTNPLQIIVPLGISFFTFECIAYLVDVYRGAPATASLLQFAAYKLFFAKLLSGPITRYHNLATQFKTISLPSTATVSEGLWLIASGAFQKAILADYLGRFVDLCFGDGNLERAGSTDLWLAIFAYGLQLYLNFNGYVDIARGSALLFGIVLPENFDFPYFATSIADFWRRWHMTLGDWLRNYIYFPLGGSRRGLLRTCTNLMIVMVVAGVWHGAALGFVVWGALHGFGLVIHRLVDSVSDRSEKWDNFWQHPIGIFIAWILTQSLVFMSWIWFRLPNLQDSSLVIQRLWGHPADIQFAQKVYLESFNLTQSHITILLLVLALAMAMIYFCHRQLKLQFNWPVKLLFVPISLYAVWLLAPEGALPYIYFDF